MPLHNSKADEEIGSLGAAASPAKGADAPCLEEQLREMRQRLQKCEARYKTLLEHTGAALFIHDLDGRILSANSQACQNLGYAKEELLCLNVKEIETHYSTKDMADLWRQLSTKDSLHVEGNHRRKDGSAYPVELQISGFELQDQKIILALARDTAAQEKASELAGRREQELSSTLASTREKYRASEERFRTIFECCPLGIALVNASNHKVVQVNQRIADFLGYSRQELAGKSVAELTHPEAMAQERPFIQRMISGSLPVFQMDKRYIRKDGALVWGRLTASLMPVGGQETPMAIGIVEDITERKKAEREFIEAKEHMEVFLNNVDDIVSYHGLDGSLTALNRANEVISGYTLEEFEADPQLWRAIIHPGNLEEAENFFANLAGKVDRYRTEYRLRTKKGEWRWIESRMMAAKDEQGVIQGYYCVERDVTEQKQAEEERKRFAERMLQSAKLESLGVLAGGIAHDFNNLLMSILGYSDLVLSDLPSISPIRSSIKQIEAGARRAAELCKQLLAYSGRGKFEICKIDLRALVEDMMRLLEISISRKAVLRYQFAENLPAIEADPTQIRQVFMNLVINASEAIGDRSGVITISTGARFCDKEYLRETFLDSGLPEGPYVYFEISDTGCGMTPEIKARIFDPFFTTKFAGRGLGLPAVLGIVRGHKGALKIYTEEGRGTSFKVLFPAVEGPAEFLPSSSPEEKPWQGKGTVLVIDDEESVLTVSRLYLERHGFAVLSAADGRVGLEIFRKQSKDIVLVLLDLTMPHLSGEETFRELRRIQPNVHVLLSSGYNEEEVTGRFSGKGLAGFIQKPYKSAELIRHIRSILGNPPAADVNPAGP